ncbi:hypothetical protein [Cellulomonas wangsupingiae]|uniref:DUF2231 domain-containing protein n=1 Tax=Cellulomonas wangsupingiae TaxID=2968085 RepID=A0ABY5K6Y2_9CELL|nr:hypothetical protein [Cellulomonas wangsupingiae]MCC2335039.1 hypothetical protein [Cellulomonas wangsupingiae]UUI65538.1 hypothetical protein NP075_02000 [Cellulomonas wangsupingiae]
MPAHVVLGCVALLVAVLVATAALVYALAPSGRPSLRWPLVAGTAVGFAVAVVAGQAGGSLLDTVMSSGSSLEAAAAQAHGHGSDALVVSLFFLLVWVLVSTWKMLRPSRDSHARSARIAAGVLVLIAVATIASAALVLYQALQAVSLGHPSWGGV